MTTAWRCAPCQRMRRIQITQWSGARACNLLAKIEFRCGWLRWREQDCVGVLLSRSAPDRVAATRAHESQAVSASCHCKQNFCPPSGSDTRLQIRRAPQSAATWVDVIKRCIMQGGELRSVTCILTRIVWTKVHIRFNELLCLYAKYIKKKIPVTHRLSVSSGGGQVGWVHSFTHLRILPFMRPNGRFLCCNE